MTLKGRRGQSSLPAFAHHHSGFSNVLVCYCRYQIAIDVVVYDSTHLGKLTYLGMCLDSQIIIYDCFHSVSRVGKNASKAY